MKSAVLDRKTIKGFLGLKRIQLLEVKERDMCPRWYPDQGTIKMLINLPQGVASNKILGGSDKLKNAWKENQ